MNCKENRRCDRRAKTRGRLYSAFQTRYFFKFMTRADSFSACTDTPRRVTGRDGRLCGEVFPLEARNTPNPHKFPVPTAPCRSIQAAAEARAPRRFHRRLSPDPPHGRTDRIFHKTNIFFIKLTLFRKIKHFFRISVFSSQSYARSSHERFSLRSRPQSAPTPRGASSPHTPESPSKSIEGSIVSAGRSPQAVKLRGNYRSTRARINSLRSGTATGRAGRTFPQNTIKPISRPRSQIDCIHNSSAAPV